MLRENSEYEILTPRGFVDFDGVQKIKKDVVTVYCGDIECKVSTNHTFVVNGEDIDVGSLDIGDVIQHKSYGDIEITNIEFGGVEFVYDPINVNGGVYYGNDILHHNCSFLGSESTLLSEQTLKKLLAQDLYDPIQYLGKRDTIRVFENPKQGAQYVLGVDVAKGTREHYSTIQVFRINSVKPVQMDQVCVFECNETDVYEFSGVVDRVARTYNNSYIMCENNSEGAAVVNQLWWEYENEGLVCEGTKTTKLGIRATTKTKPAANLLMKKLVEDGSILIRDYRTIQQFLTFLDMGNNKFNGNGNDDDLISAFYWACYFFEFDLLEESMSFKEEEKEDDDVWGIFGLDDPDEEGYEVLVR